MRKVLPILAISSLIVLGSCSPSKHKSDDNVLESPGITEGKMTDEEITNYVNRANKGDINSARYLHKYYEIQDNPMEIQRWEDWLVDHQDIDSMHSQSLKMLVEATNLPDSNPKKRVNLYRAKKLIDFVLKNSRNTNEAIYLRKRIILEIDRSKLRK